MGKWGEKSSKKDSLNTELDVLKQAKKLEKDIASVKKHFQDKAGEEAQHLDSVLFDDEDESK